MSAPNLDIKVQPSHRDNAYYLPLAPKSQGAPERLKIALRLKIKNEGTSLVTVTGITFSFPDSTVGASTMRGEQLAMDPGDSGRIGRGKTVTWSNGTVALTEDETAFNQVYIDAPAPPKIKVNIHCEGFDEPASKTMDLIPWVDPTGEGAVIMPFAVTNLEYNEYLVTSAAHFYNGGAEGTQIFAHDFRVYGLDPSGAWSELHANANGTSNSHYRIFGMPVRAIAKGDVFKVEDKWTDNRGLQGLHENPGMGPAGNHIWVRHGNLEVKYAHLRKDSTIVSVGQEVEAGQKLGEVGNSGNANGIPHLHLECRDTSSGTLRGFTFKKASMLERTQVRLVGTLPWVRLKDNGICQEEAAIRPHGNDPGLTGPGVPDLDRFAAEVFGGVFDGGGGLVLVDGTVGRVPPRGPMWELARSFIALDAAQQTDHPTSDKSVSEIADDIAGIAKELGKKNK